MHIFNAILTHGKFPKLWGLNTLTPLHKKGSPNVCDNYRGIAVASCIAKFFLTILQRRLCTFAENNNLIPNNQIGYKKGSRTADHILTLKNIIDKYLLKAQRQYLYACFVDFKSAFDSVWREGLFYKLLQNGVGGNFLSVLQSMYTNVKYSVKIDGWVSEPICSSVGVKPGCVLSPLLFNLYVADMPLIFDNTCDPVNVNMLNTNCLLFADDLVLLSESTTGLQSCLNRLQKYCETWGLTINLSKTKVIIFNKGGHKISRFKFCLHGDPIEIVQSYCYLGIVFSSCGSFSGAVKTLTDKARKAFFALRKFDTSNDPLLTIKLFDALVLPVTTYNIEVWGPYFLTESRIGCVDAFKSMLDSNEVEKINVKLCKYVLGVSRKSSNDAVRGELGRHPILLGSMHRWIKFAIRTLSLPLNTLVKISIPPVSDCIDKPSANTWASKNCSLITSMLTHHGMEFHADTLYNVPPPTIIQQQASLCYNQAWLNAINKNYYSSKPNKLKTYANFKKSFGMENYLLCMKNKNKRRSFTKLRISAHHLPIEKGRYSRPVTPRDQRFCQSCDMMSIGDEFHFLLVCPKHDEQRLILFDQLSKFTILSNEQDQDTFIHLMSCCQGDTEVSNLVCRFVENCLTDV